MKHREPALLDIGQPIRTARLELRPFGRGDLDDLVVIESDPAVARYLYREVRTPTETAEALAAKVRATRIVGDGGAVSLAAVLDGRVIGDLTLTYTSGLHRQAEIGYVFGSDHHGRGLATEAAGAVVDLAFARLRAHRTYGRIDARNTASARVLEKLGMRREAHLVENEWVKGEWTDEVVYGILDQEWADRRPAGSTS